MLVALKPARRDFKYIQVCMFHTTGNLVLMGVGGGSPTSVSTQVFTTSVLNPEIYALVTTTGNLVLMGVGGGGGGGGLQPLYQPRFSQPLY